MGAYSDVGACPVFYGTWDRPCDDTRVWQASLFQGHYTARTLYGKASTAARLQQCVRQLRHHKKLSEEELKLGEEDTNFDKLFRMAKMFFFNNIFFLCVSPRALKAIETGEKIIDLGVVGGPLKVL